MSDLSKIIRYVIFRFNSLERIAFVQLKLDHL